MQGASAAYAPETGLRYLFIDFNAFFAAVEQHDNPSLRGRPVVVAPLQSEHTMAIAASYEARPFGVNRGTRIFEARDLCPDLVVRPARHDRYAAVHRLLMAEIERHLPLAKVYSIDEAAFHLSRSEQTAAPAIEVARRVMAGICENVGPALRASIGLAQTRLLAKLAAESKKPDGLTVLAPSDLPHALADMRLEKIPGIGGGVAARLAKSGVDNFMKLWALQPKHARKIWGSVQGERFWYALHGFEVDEPETKKSMIGHGRVLTRGYESPEEARIVARALLLKTASRLRYYKFFARRLTVGVKVRDHVRWEGARSFSPCQDSFHFLSLLDELWDELRRALRTAGPRPRLASVNVFLSGLVEEGASAVHQGDLFAEPAVCTQQEKRAQLWGLIDYINSDPDKKFARLAGVSNGVREPYPVGESTGGEVAGAAASVGRIVSRSARHISLAGQASLDLNYLGAKIAFSRVPEEAEFLF